MDPTLRKLRFRGQDPVLVVNAPDSFAPALEALRAEVRVEEQPGQLVGVTFALCFARNAAELAGLAPLVLDGLGEDAVLWFCYPKKSSRRYTSDITREQGWEPVSERGFEGVAQVAVDEDWSALRLRHVDLIPKTTRSPRNARSTTGKRRAGGKGERPGER